HHLTCPRMPVATEEPLPFVKDGLPFRELGNPLMEDQYPHTTIESNLPGSSSHQQQAGEFEELEDNNNTGHKSPVEDDMGA
ncbi:hypothetical protein DXG01_005873, partial [Tephrocybe rancida]